VTPLPGERPGIPSDNAQRRRVDMVSAPVSSNPGRASVLPTFGATLMPDLKAQFPYIEGRYAVEVDRYPREEGIVAGMGW